MSRLRLLFVELVAVAAYLGLAIWGEGGFARFFSHAPLVALVVVGAVLMVASFFTQGNISPGVREDRSNRWVITAFSLIALLSAYFPPFADRNEIWIIGGEGMRWTGVALSALGGALRMWPVFVLGRRFSGLVAIQPGHELVTGGIYRYIRHPSYLGLLVNALGWALAFRSGVGIVLAALNLPVVVARIGAEERLLASEFGAQYAAYRARTARLIPGVY
ncbi:MAG TPA: isoprenylcysteine carboxylmethyltransferase family protein [Stellaceae bacterium]|nr:isoprenylcysteine carboxylmethyltransferase family protein [Stellaceae bacterium]